MFLRVTDHIEKRLYLLLGIPVTYGIQPSYVFHEKSSGPIYIPMDGETGRGNYTISHMIDMYENKIPFEFAHDGDLLDVDKQLGYFLDYARTQKFADKESQEFIRRAKNLYVQINKKARVLRKLNPGKNFQPSQFLSLIDQIER